MTLGGESLANYVLAATGNQSETTATINKAQITISGITAENKTYDGNTTATLDYSNVVFGGIVGGDKLTVTATGAFESASAGTGKNVAISGLTLGGESIANYELSATGNQSSTTAAINKAALTVTAKDAAITYGEDHSSILSSSYTVTGMVNGEAASVVTGAMGIENATNLSGAGKLKADATDLYKFTIGTLTAANYDITFVAEDGTDVKALTVNKLDLSATVDFATSKFYDGTTAVTVNSSSLNTVLANDTVTFNAELVYNDANVANANKIVSQTWEITGADAANYNLAAFTETAGTITAKEITVSGITASNKVYDGTTDATVNTTGATFTGMITGDNLTVSTSGTFGDKNVGTGKTVTFGALTLGGTDAGNYVLAATGNQSSVTADITAKEITVSGITASNKVYDGTTDATVNTTGATFTGMITGDNLTVSTSGTFGDKNVGTGKTVTFGALTLGGTDAGNYVLAATGNQSSVTADITAKEISINGVTIADKIYDGNTSATISDATVSGVIGSDVVSVDISGASATFANANVGTGILVNANGLALTGADSANYKLTSNAFETTGNITKATVTVTADAQSKVYGTDDPSLTYQVSGLVGSDALTGELTRDAGENVGTYAITKGTLAASSNYDLVFTGADLTITKATVTVTADAQSKVYGETDPSLTYQVSGLVGSDALTGALGRDAGENVGTYAITQGTLSAGENYDMNFTGALFTINAKPEEPGTGSDPSTDISVNPSFNADNDASSPDYRVYGKPQREAARTAWLQDAMAPFTGGKFSVTAVEDGRRHGVELGFDATPISTSVQTHHEMYGIHDDEILDDHKVFDRYEHHVIEAQEPVSLDGDAEMDLSAAQDVMDALEDLLLEIPAVELTAKASQFHDDFDTALNDLLTI